MRKTKVIERRYALKLPCGKRVRHAIADGRKVTVRGGTSMRWKRFLTDYFHTSNVPTIRNIPLRYACVLEVPAGKTCLAFVFLNRPPFEEFEDDKMKRFRTITEFVLERLPTSRNGILPLLDHATLAVHEGRIYPSKSPVGELLKQAAERDANPCIEALLNGSLWK